MPTTDGAPWTSADRVHITYQLLSELRTGPDVCSGSVDVYGLGHCFSKMDNCGHPMPIVDKDFSASLVFSILTLEAVLEQSCTMLEQGITPERRFSSTRRVDRFLMEPQLGGSVPIEM